MFANKNILSVLKDREDLQVYEKQGQVVYQESKKSIVVAMDPVAEEGVNPLEVFSGFLGSIDKDKRLSGYYLSEPIASQIESHFKYRKYKVGESMFTDLSEFTLKGYKSRDIRRARNFAIRQNYSFSEVDHQSKPQSLSSVLRLERNWLVAKKRFWLWGRIGFILSPLSRRQINRSGERWFVVKDKGEVVAFLTLVNMEAQKAGASYYIDKMYYKPKHKGFEMDFLMSSVFLQLKREGASEVYLGLCPFCGLKPKNALEKLLDFSYQTGWFYGAKGLFQFKSKYSTRREQRFMMIKDRPLLSMVDLFVATFPRFKKIWFFA